LTRLTAVFLPLSQVKCRLNQLDKMISLMKLAERENRLKSEEPLLITICDVQLRSATEERSSTDLTGAFIHSHLFIETLMEMHIYQDALLGRNVDDFIQMCTLQYHGIESQLKLINTFQRSYSPDQALMWYTRDSFVYRLLNKALRLENIDILLLFQFFIRDIHEQLEQLAHLHEMTTMSKTTTFYRAQLMSKEEVDVLRYSLGNIISMKSFLSTTLSKAYALFLLGDPEVTNDDNVKRVLFEISLEIDDIPSFNDIPFANISEKSDFPEEEEVLFSIGSIFRITDVRKEGKVFWKVHLVHLPSSKNPLFKPDGNHLNRIYKYLKEHELIDGSDQMGCVLHLGGKFNETEWYYRQKIDYWSRIDPRIIEQQEEEDDKLLKKLRQVFKSKPRKRDYVKAVQERLDFYYFQLALVARNKGDYNACLNWSEYLRKYDPHSFSHQVYLCYYHLLTGEVCEHLGQLAKARVKYEKAWRQLMALPEGKGDATVSTEIIINLANISLKLFRKEWKPLEFYEKALSIYRKSLPLIHPKIGQKTNIQIDMYPENVFPLTSKA
ncbi:unnamed protein product, partial [Didymodactylos carnosus]